MAQLLQQPLPMKGEPKEDYKTSCSVGALPSCPAHMKKLETTTQGLNSLLDLVEAHLGGSRLEDMVLWKRLRAKGSGRPDGMAIRPLKQACRTLEGWPLGCQGRTGTRSTMSR